MAIPHSHQNTVDSRQKAAEQRDGRHRSMNGVLGRVGIGVLWFYSGKYLPRSSKGNLGYQMPDTTDFLHGAIATQAIR